MQADDVLVSTVRPNLNAVAIVPHEYNGITASTGFTVLRADKEKLDPGYLYSWVKHPRFVDEMTKLATGASYPAVSDTIVKNSLIPLPHIAEQKRISALLDEADALRRKRRETLAKLDMLVQSVFLDMFGDPVTNPKGWNVNLLGELLDRPVQNGAYYPPEQYSTEFGKGVEMVHMGDAFYGIVKRGNLKRVLISAQEAQKYALSPNDLLIARRSLVYEGSAKPCLIPEVGNDPLIFESSLIRVTPKISLMSPLYLFHFLSNQRAKDRYVLPFVTRSTISGINQSNLVKIALPVPPFWLQQEFASRVTEINAIRERHEVSLRQQETLFAALQHSAFTLGDTSALTTITQPTDAQSCLTLDF